jgi:hypothetical protein
MPFATIIDAGFIDITENNAMQVIKKERDTYNKVWNEIEEYCIKHKLIVSNEYVLVGMECNNVNIYKKIYRIYTSNPFHHANKLTNNIHQKTDKEPNQKYTRLKTIKENEEFVIDYNMRQVVEIFKLQKHKLEEPINIIKPVKIGKILYMPSELEIIDIYHRLYDPDQCCDDDNTHEIEELLFQQIIKRKEKGILGGNRCKVKKKHILEALKISIVSEWLIGKTNIILIGPWAHDWIKMPNNLCINCEKIQLIGNISSEELLIQLQKYIRTITDFEISVRTQELNIPKDFRTVRYTFYIHIHSERGTIQKPFLDLFNCADFEVVPCTKISNILIGNKWVMLRFLFIDLWVIRIIKSMGILSSDILNKKLVYIWGLIDFFRNKYTMSCDNIKFIGIYKNALITKKISNLKGKTYYPYYPEVYIKQFNKYRDI